MGHLFQGKGAALFAAALSFFILLPLISILQTAVMPDGAWKPEAALSAVMAPENGKTIINSLILGFLVTIVATLFAAPAAWFLSRTRLAGKAWLDVLCLVPFMTPPYIASMGWILFMQKRGLAEQLFPALESVTPHFFSLAGLVLVMALHGFPFLVTILKNAIAELPPSMEESAAVFGAPFRKRLFRVVIPLLTPSYAVGALLVFVRTLSEYGTPATLGQRIGYPVFTTSIHDFAALQPVQFGQASALSVVLTVICLAFWLMQKKVSGSGYDFSGRGQRARMTSGKKSVLLAGSGFLTVLFFFSAVIPWFTVLAVSLMKLRGKGLAAANLTFAHYHQFFFDNDGAFSALTNSLILAAGAATIASLIGAAAAVYCWRRKSALARSVESIALLPEMVPGIVLVLGMMIFWNTIYDWIPLYNTLGILLVAYVVLFLPFAVQYTQSALFQISPSLMAAARVFGASPMAAFFRVAVPLAWRGILAGWMMIFIISFRELVAPSLMAPTNTEVVSTFIMNQFEQGDVSAGMCMAVTTMILTSIAFFLMDTFAGRK